MNRRFRNCMEDIMGNYYYFYSPKDGKLVDDGKYAGMPFLRNEADKYGKRLCGKMERL